MRKASLKITRREKLQPVKRSDAFSPHACAEADNNDRAASKEHPPRSLLRDRNSRFNILPSSYLRYYRMTRCPCDCTQPVKARGTAWSREQATICIHPFKRKHGLVFMALSEADKYISECECGEWIKNEITSAKISLCHRLTLCFGGRSATEQLSGIINVFSPEDRTGGNKQRSSVLASALGLPYHSHHLQVLQIRPLRGQQLLCDEVGPICWEPLQRRCNTEESVSETDWTIQPVQPVFGALSVSVALSDLFF